MQFSKLKKLLYNDLDVYEGFDWTQYPDTLSPGSMPANEVLIGEVQKLKPTLVIEIGSFLGWSASGMALEMRHFNKDSVVLCIDTWMGGADHWYEATFDPKSRIKRKNGYPTLYYNFLANICYGNLQENILPFAYPSNTAAEILKKVFNENQIKADMIYVDGSHAPIDVFYDCLNYWDLLRDGGVMFGDDWTCEGVVQGVHEFCTLKDIKNLRIHSNHVHWFLTK